MRVIITVVVMALSAAAQAETGEWPERIRRQKEILAALGYFSGPINRDDSEAFARSREAFARDAGLSTEIPIMFSERLEAIHKQNLAARANCKGKSGRATACLSGTARPAGQ